jgi:hypothetical protein
MNIDTDILPWVYTIDGQTNRVIDFPHPLDEPLDCSPDIFILWARETSLELEILTLEGKVINDVEVYIEVVPGHNRDSYLDELHDELNKILIKQKEVEDVLLERKLDEFARRESIREMELRKTSRSVDDEL